MAKKAAKATKAPKDAFLSLGETVAIRTVTMHYIGTVTRIVGRWVRLEPAVWLADSGRWSTALATGTVSEAERYPGPCWVNLDTATDVSPWVHAVPGTT